MVGSQSLLKTGEVLSLVEDPQSSQSSRGPSVQQEDPQSSGELTVQGENLSSVDNPLSSGGSQSTRGLF